MKKIVFGVFAAVFFLIFSANTSASLEKKRGFEKNWQEEEKIKKEFLGILENFLRQQKDNNKHYNEIAVKTIDEYKKFLSEHPSSFLCDEAKLAIAEFYSIIWITDKTKNWMGEARKWLDDVIKNHPRADFWDTYVTYDKEGKNYLFFQLFPTKEKTAAWALYYRAAWFPGSPGQEEDLDRIIKEYSGSEKTVVLAEKLLRKIRK